MSKEAMKLALEALENSVDLVRKDAYQAEKLYGNYPTRQGKVNGLKVLADDHEKAITALREALAKPDFWEGYIPEPVKPAPVQRFDHTAAANAALRDAQNRSTAIAKTSVKRPQNCGTNYCSCIECVMEPAQQEPDWKAEYLKSVESGCITLDELREANAELDATNRQVEILNDALAESRREIDALVALARADEREACAKEAESWDCHLAAAEIRARSNT